MPILAPGLIYTPHYLDRAAQAALVEAVRGTWCSAPLFTPRMPKTAKPFSVQMTNCGALGWVSDAERGYRYQSTHPLTGEPWPPMPDVLLQAWRDLGDYPHPPEACLINYYGSEARMGLHQDRDEDDLDAPVVSLSLGDTCVFRIGGQARTDRTISFRLSSGDAIILSGASRLAFHGVDRLLAGSSTLVPGGGRINLTMRRVTKPPIQNVST